MSPHSRPVVLLCATLALLTSWSPSSAEAKDMEGRLGLGLELSSRLEDSGLSFKYWGSNVVGFQSTLNFTIVDPGKNEAGEEQDVQTDIGLALRGLFSISRTEQTNFFLGAGIQIHLVFPDGNDEQELDFLFGVEHYFTDYFSVGGHVAFQVSLGNDTDLKLGNATTWGSTFVFYF